MIIDPGWRGALECSFTRRLVWLETTQNDVQTHLSQLLDDLDLEPHQGILVSDRKLAEVPVVLPRALVQHLGRTYPFAVFDAFAGLNPNTFAQLAGTVLGGGVLILISPNKQRWLSYADPEYAHLGVTQSPLLACRFLTWFIANLESDTSVLRVNLDLTPHIQPPIDLGPSPNLSAQPQTNGVYLGSDQSAVVLAILAHWRQPRSCLLLDADRGRGKSAALGLALALQASFSREQVAITSPDKRAIDSLITQFHRLKPHNPAPRWIAPAELLKALDAGASNIRSLIVDEAAGIPIPVLEQLSNKLPHILLASTQQGYEGFGSGYGVRFIKRLRQQQPHTRRLSLQQSLRWASPDPLEIWVGKTLLLANRDLLEPVESGLIELDLQSLIQQPGRLSELYQLLAQAHYRTSPADLRVLLDSPGQRLFAHYQESQLSAVLWVAVEGDIESQLAHQIAQGRRRPSGNLLPQSLIHYLGWVEAGKLLFWRVVRVAVRADRRRGQIARGLIEYAQALATDEGVDFIGASYAAYPELNAFWQRLGFSILRRGEKVDSIAAVPAALVLKSLQAESAHWLALYSKSHNEINTIKNNNLNNYNNSDYKEILERRYRLAMENFAYHFAPLSLVRGEIIKLYQADEKATDCTLTPELITLFNRLISSATLKSNEVKQLRLWLANRLIAK